MIARATFQEITVSMWFFSYYCMGQIERGETLAGPVRKLGFLCSFDLVQPFMSFDQISGIACDD